MEEKKLGLQANALGLSESIIMGVAGTAPSFSLAATTGVLLGAVGGYSLACVFYCGLIDFFRNSIWSLKLPF